MTELVESYADICEELDLTREQRRALWGALADQIERVASELNDPEGATDDEIERACRRLRVPTIRELAVRIRNTGADYHNRERSVNDPASVLLKNLPLIERIIASICHRRGMDADEIEEFAAEVRLRLVEDDYAIIRAFAGRATFGTYMAAVIGRMLLDSRLLAWGKWRNSAEARRLGGIAIDLERILLRDGRTFDEAFVLIRARHPEVTRTELERLSDQLPARHRRRLVADVDEQPSLPHEPQTEIAATLARIVKEFIDRLPREDQLLFQLRFGADMSTPEIARALHLDAQALYRRYRRHITQLRVAFEAAGITTTEVTKLIGSDTPMLDFGLKTRDSTTADDALDDSNPLIDRHEK